MASGEWTSRLLLGGRGLLVLLLFSTLLLPRFLLGSAYAAYRIDFRAEDILLLILCGIVLLLSLSKSKSYSLADASPTGLVEKSFIFFLIACQISIFNGMLMHTLDKPILSILYLLKYTQYFLVFWVTSRLVTQQQDCLFLLKAFFVLGLAVAAYGYWEYWSVDAVPAYPNFYRLYERFPFRGDANHVGGFLVVWMGFFLGAYLTAEKPSYRLLFFVALLFAFFPFVCTYSRKSYFALAVMLTFAFLFRGCRKKLLLFICVLILLACLLPTRLGERLTDLGGTFAATDRFNSSWAWNVARWKQSLWNFEKFFMLGSGLASRHRFFYESQFMLVLCETGILGLSGFLLLCLSPLRKIVSWFQAPMSIHQRGVARGWLIAFVGIMIHNLSLISLSIVKIAIPFWILTAVVLVSLSLATKELRWATKS